MRQLYNPIPSLVKFFLTPDSQAQVKLFCVVILEDSLT